MSAGPRRLVDLPAGLVDRDLVGVVLHRGGRAWRIHGRGVDGRHLAAPADPGGRDLRPVRLEVVDPGDFPVLARILAARVRR